MHALLGDAGKYYPSMQVVRLIHANFRQLFLFSFVIAAGCLVEDIGNLVQTLNWKFIHHNSMRRKGISSCD